MCRLPGPQSPVSGGGGEREEPDRQNHRCGDGDLGRLDDFVTKREGGREARGLLTFERWKSFARGRDGEGALAQDFCRHVRKECAIDPSRVGDEDATHEVLTSDGWFWTGDVGVLDDGGHLYIVDRIKDIIIVSGFNVYPAEVENVLLDHPDVRGAVVVGNTYLDTVVNESHFFIDFTPAEIIALAATGDEVVIASRYLGNTEEKTVTIGLAVLTTEMSENPDLYRFRAPSCGFRVKRCLEELPGGSRDLFSCGDFFDVVSCADEVGVTLSRGRIDGARRKHYIDARGDARISGACNRHGIRNVRHIAFEYSEVRDLEVVRNRVVVLDHQRRR